MSPLEKIEIKPIGTTERTSSNGDIEDRSVVSKIVIRKDLAKALDGIEDFSHIFVIFWMHKISNVEKRLIHPGGKPELPTVGIFATRAPIRPNPVGLTLVELVGREENVLWVRGLDALDGTPILDIKPYPDWACGRWIVVTEFRAPKWLRKINR